MESEVEPVIEKHAYITGDELVWQYPEPKPRVIEHKERICQAVVRGEDGKVSRHLNGKAIKTEVVVPSYKQTVK